jgi:hypothetical protein
MDRGRPGPERQHPRVTIDAFVRVSGADKEYVFRTRDLSEGGLFLYTRVRHLYPFDTGTQLTIELYDFDSVVELKAKVVRIVEPGTSEAERFPTGFALQIIDIDETNRRRLGELIAHAQRGEALY